MLAQFACKMSGSHNGLLARKIGTKNAYSPLKFGLISVFRLEVAFRLTMRCLCGMHLSFKGLAQSGWIKDTKK